MRGTQFESFVIFSFEWKVSIDLFTISIDLFTIYTLLSSTKEA